MNKLLSKTFLCFYITMFSIYLCIGCSSTASDTYEAESNELTSIAEDSTGADTSHSILQYEEKENEFQIPLSEDMSENLDTATYSIIGYDEDGYYQVLCGRPAVLDDDNVVHIPKDQYVITLYFEDEDKSHPLTRLNETCDEDGSLHWNTDFFALINDIGNIDFVYESCFMHLNIVSDKDSVESYLPYSMSPRLDGTNNPLTESVAYEFWNNILITKAYASELYNADGAIIASNEWTKLNMVSYYHTYPNIKEGLKFQKKSLQEMDGTYYCQLNLEFQDHSSLNSDFILLQNDPDDPFSDPIASNDNTIATTKTDNGEFTFEIYDDHAVLTAYSGEDEQIIIPNRINNVPVTTIANQVFANNNTLREVNLPDTLTCIKYHAFYETTLSMINLPDSLEYIGYEAFGAFMYKDASLGDTCFEIETLNIGKNVKWIGDGAFCGYCIREFQISEDNPYYMSSDGIIYSKDQSFLLAYPTGKNGEFTIPDGVTGIAQEAFIMNGAFMDVIPKSEGITSLTLSDSVSAFSCGSLPRNIKALTIGSGLSDWKNISSCSELEELIINSNNPYYLLEDGIIYNGDKTELIYCFDADSVSEYTIPESVTLIDSNAFSSNLSLREINFPANLSLKDTEISNLAYTLSCMNNLLNINVEEDNTAFRSVDGVLFTNDMSTLICYPSGKESDVYSIPDGVTTISPHAFAFNKKLETLNLPASLTEFKIKEEYNNFLNTIENLTEINISVENPYYSASGPFLSSKTSHSLVFFTGNYHNSIIHLPDDILIVSEGTFELSIDNTITEFYIPEGVTDIEADNFNDIPHSDQWDIIDIYLPESLTEISNSSFQNSPGIVLHVYEDSYAAEYAKAQQIDFEIIE